MDPRIFLRLSRYRRFWRLRARFQQFAFAIHSSLFQVRYFANEERTSASIVVSILGLTLYQLFLAIGIAVALQVFELALVPDLISWWPIPNPSGYVTWLGAIAQIGGVFIALYFTAVTAAAGAIYAQVPNNVRDLLARERVGNVYIRYLTLATFLPLCLIALRFLGFEPMRIGVPFMLLMAGTGIIAFAALGRRAFNLFEPTSLAGSLFSDLGRWLRQVSAGGFRWRDRSFQAHAHRQTVFVLDTLQTLSDLAARHANLDGAPLLRLSVAVLAILEDYQRQKLRIPTDSLWFGQKLEQRSWYQTEDSTVQLAHRSGISLNPTPVPECDWLENRLEPVLLRCFELNVARKRVENVRSLLEGADTYIAALAMSGNVRRAVRLAERIRGIHEKQESSSAIPTGEQVEQAEDVGITDAICVLPLRILLSYRGGLEQRTPELAKRRIEGIRWLQASSIYKSGFVIEELRQLEWLFPRIRMELAVEGVIRTPVWYQQELVSKAQAESVNDCVGAIIECGRTFFQNWSDRLVKKGRVWESAAVLSRSIEYLSKLEVHLGYCTTYADSLKATRHLMDLPWPDINPRSWSEMMGDFHDTLGQAIAKHISMLSISRKPEGIPDYLGQFIHKTGEELFDALVAQRPADVRALFPSYLAGSLILFDSMKPPTPKFDSWTEQKLQIAVAPLLDILELGGYARLLADLHQNDQLWVAVSSVWDEFLRKNPGTLPLIAAIITAGTPRFQIPHRGLVRTNWSIRVQQELNKLPRRRFVRGGVVGTFGSDTPIHLSPLIRYYAKYPFQKGREIFAALYLSKQRSAEGLDWGLEANDLGESLRREEESYRRNVEADEEKDA